MGTNLATDQEFSQLTAIYDISLERQPSLIASQSDRDVARVMIPRDAPSGSVLAVLEDGTARTFTIRDQRIEKTADYSTPPWFADSIDLGNLLVSISLDRFHLNVATSGESQPVVPGYDGRD